MIDLWEHQKKAVEIAKTKRNLALFFDPGTGKTGTTIQALRDEYNKYGSLLNTLIIAPITVCQKWKREFALFSKINPEKIFVLDKTGKSRTKELTAIIEKKEPAIIITNYESVQIKDFYELLLQWGPRMFVADESHRLKDSASKRFKKFIPIAWGADRRFILTGTPIPNSMMDIYGQFQILNPEIFDMNFWRFKKSFFYDANAGMPAHVHFPKWIPKPGADKQLASIIAEHSVQAKKEECLDLPELHQIPISVKMSPKQERIYESMKHDFVAELKNTVAVAEFAMTKNLRLRQIVAGFVAPDSDSRAEWVDDLPRLEALSELLESLGSEKVIIWTTFKPCYAKIGKLCEELGLKATHLTGLQSQGEKEQAKQDFRKGDTQVLISNPAAGGVGEDFIEARYSIYYDRDYSAINFEQSKARNHRGGSEIHDKITHYHLIAEGTLDEEVYRALKDKLNVSEAILSWAKTLDTVKSKVYQEGKEDTSCPLQLNS